MSFWEKIKQGFRRFMAGRHGADQLSMALLMTGLITLLLGSILGGVQVAAVSLLGLLLYLAGFVVYVLCIYRMMSRNTEKRNEENRRYMTAMEKSRTQRRQAKVRFQNRKKYKYFKCPGCRAWLRIPRGTGVVTVTCSRCHNSFTQKA